MEGVKVTTSVRKAKKKQVKDEIDRIKQAEKKKRRLEKALATSAAIRSELEKKKLKKKEEQERLDEEGAAIAEAVALHVLLGEDSDNSSEIMLKKDEGLASWDNASNMDIIVGGHAIFPYQDHSKCSLENIGWVSDAHRYGRMWNHLDNSKLMVSSNHLGRDVYNQYYAEERWGSMGVSAGHVAAQAVSSLKIADDVHMDAYLFNRMLRG